VKDYAPYLDVLTNHGGRLELQMSVSRVAAEALLIRAQFSSDLMFGEPREDTLSAEPAASEPQDRLRLRFIRPDSPAGTRQFGRIHLTLPP
jgi:hypothetical protein